MRAGQPSTHSPVLGAAAEDGARKDNHPFSFDPEFSTETHSATASPDPTPQPKADSWQPLGGTSACRWEARPLCAGSGVGRGTECPGMLLLDGSSQIGQFLALADR